jgi:uncharacterized protein (TIGR02996 family)
MSDGDALLSAILAEPDEDTPRLAYADWLDEVGGASDRARAEFIRAQIDLGRMPPGERNYGLEGRAKLLLELHREAWLAPLRHTGAPLSGEGAHCQFRRGFVEIVWMPAAWFVARAEALFARVPARELRVTRTTVEELAAVAASGYFPRLGALDLSERKLGDAAARVLTQRPAVAAITRLRLRGCGLTDAAAYRLADAEFDWPLRELDVVYNSEISAAGLKALTDRFGDAVIAAPPAG